MCNLVVPIRTCSKCRKDEPLFPPMSPRHEKEGSREFLDYMDTAQDCFSRHCAFSTEHPTSCGHCWLTCKHMYGKARMIHGGSPSYVCHSCEPRARRQPAWKRPRPAHPSKAGRNVVRIATRGFLDIAQFLSR